MFNAQQPFVEDQQIPEATYDRPSGRRSQSRSVVLASNGIVATSHPLAAEVGLDVLKRGGNAFDAAIATNAMLGLVEPMSCGIGGDLFAICWDAKGRKLSGLNASGRSPFSLTRDVFTKQGLDQIPTYRPLSWSVPGCVDGWAQLTERFGSQSLAELLAPAIEYAESGFPVTEVIAGYWASAESRLAEWEDSATTYLPNGQALRNGEMFRNPHLASSYREIAEHGRDAFYRGAIADEIVAFSQRNGGYFEKRDFEDHSSEWVDPVSTDYRGHTVWELPPNGQGIAVLQMLNILEQFDVASLGHNSAELLHLLVEAKKLAFADRATFYADPAFGELPIEELISKEYSQRQRERMSLDRAATDVPPGDPKLSRGDTVYLTVVDKDRNCCSLIQSIYYGFGSQVVPGNTGFALQNRGNLFALDETHLNRLEPHKRPFHTIIPGFVTRDGLPHFCFGVMGGDMQPQGQVQVLMNLIDFGMNVQAAGDAARICHFGSQTPTGLPMAEGGGSVGIESGVPAESAKGLLHHGHQLVRSPGSFGGYQGILIDWDNGVLHGATEPRKDGAAVGY
ncbi:MAG: gamma-glutamyltransferase [Planctomycetota bacterium]|jgi:gamma-glutamyltranspeptidase/glutathione hydrolase